MHSKRIRINQGTNWANREVYWKIGKLKGRNYVKNQRFEITNIAKQAWIRIIRFESRFRASKIKEIRGLIDLVSIKKGRARAINRLEYFKNWSGYTKENEGS